MSKLAKIPKNQTNELYNIALKSLQANIKIINGRRYLTAGNTQFNSIWVRDVLYSSDYLRKVGMGDIVNNTIDLYMKNLIKDPNGSFYGPKGFDSMSIEWRVIKTSIRHTLGLERFSDPIEKDLRPLYKDSRDAVAIDSNLLVILAENRNKYNFSKLLSYYDNKIIDGLIVQEPHSDWQDSQRRCGSTFLTNLLYWKCLKKLKKNTNKLKKKIIETFYDNDSGLFFSVKGFPQISLEGILFAIKFKFVDREKLYKNLKRHRLWSKKNPSGFSLGPGFVTYPNYDPITLHVQVRIGLLHNYHDEYYWSWLMAFAGIVAHSMSDFDEYNKIMKRLEKIAKRDKCIAEIYRPEKNLSLVETTTYSSERPFTWGAAYVVGLCLV